MRGTASASIQFLFGAAPRSVFSSATGPPRPFIQLVYKGIRKGESFLAFTLEDSAFIPVFFESYRFPEELIFSSIFS